MTSFLDQFKPEPTPPPATSTPSRGFEDAVITAESDNVAQARRGTRNATLNKAAFNLAQALPVDTWHATLMAAAAVSGLDQVEAHQTIRSGIEGARRNPRPAHRMPGNSPQRPVQALTELVVPEDTHQFPDPVNWKQVWDNPTELEWILEPFIPAGRYIALYSPPKVGKSLLMLELAVAISNGRPALGSPTRPGRVLYIDRENDVQTDVKARLEAMGHTYGDLDNLIYHSYLSDMPDLDTPHGGTYLNELAQHHNADLVIIDTISRFINGEENDNNTWIKLHKYSAIPLKERGVTLMRLDHSGKDLDKGQRGGSAKLGDIDMVWRLSEVDPGVTYLLRCEAHRVQVLETELNLTREPRPLKHTVDTRHIAAIKEEAVLAKLDDLNVPRDAGRVVCAQALRSVGMRVRNDTLAGIVKRRKGPSLDLS